MKKIIISLLFTLLTIFGYSQQYWVFSINGDIRIDNEKVNLKQLVEGKKKIFIPQNSSISLFDNKREFIYHLASSGTHKIEDLIREKKPTAKRLSYNYLSFIKQSIFGNSNDAGVALMGERGKDESRMFLASFMHYIEAKSIPIGKELYHNFHKVPNYYLFKCEFYDEKNNPVSLINNSYVNCHPMVTNYTDADLYISIIIVSCDGNIDLYFDDDISQHIVPANSTISFDKHSRFWEKYENERILVIATEYPIDSKILFESNLQISCDLNYKFGLLQINY